MRASFRQEDLFLLSWFVWTAFAVSAWNGFYVVNKSSYTRFKVFIH